MLKKYCRNLYRSFFDATLYDEAIHQAEGFGGKHMLAAAAVVGLLFTFLSGLALYSFNKYELPFILKQIPDIVVKDSTLTVVRGPDPTTITTQDKRFRVVIDTKTPEEELYKKDAEVIVGRTVILVKQHDGFRPFPLDKIDQAVFNKNILREFFEQSYAFLILLWPLLTIGEFFKLIVCVFCVALLSYAVTAPLREEYYFETRMRIAALAMTPPYLITKITSIFIETHADQFVTKAWFGILLALVYFYVMILMIRRLDKQA